MAHVMLSYQWDKQKEVKEVYEGLAGMGFPVWMDIEGGMSGNVNDAMAQGVQNALVVCCFMTDKYQESKNCKKELNYADTLDVEIIPCMSMRGWKPRDWLGIITAGLLWMDFRDAGNMPKRIESLSKEIIQKIGEKLTLTAPVVTATSAKVTPINVDLEKKPGRAFRHKNTGKFLAESGQVKVHPASGSRSSLVLRDTPEATSYWVEERKGKGSSIYFYKNFATDGYLGYDPNGDYIYTKAQHYGAEEWVLMSDESETSGERAVVIFADYGKKYLAIVNGKLTGVSSISNECVWYLA